MIPKQFRNIRCLESDMFCKERRAWDAVSRSRMTGASASQRNLDIPEPPSALRSRRVPGLCLVTLVFGSLLEHREPYYSPYSRILYLTKYISCLSQVGKGTR